MHVPHVISTCSIIYFYKFSTKVIKKHHIYNVSHIWERTIKSLKRVNETVKNNRDKIPERFSWVLINEEPKELRSKMFENFILLNRVFFCF